MRNLIICLILLITGPSLAIEPDETGVYQRGPWEAEWNYAQARRVGDTLYVSGTVGPGADMAEQMASVYTALGETLKAYGLRPENIVRENLYTLDIEATKAAGSVRAEFYQSHQPASTWVQVTRLFEESVLVEVEVEARFPRDPE